jgi:hypothetical protein
MVVKDRVAGTYEVDAVTLPCGPPVVLFAGRGVVGGGPKVVRDPRVGRAEPVDAALPSGSAAFPRAGLDQRRVAWISLLLENHGRPRWAAALDARRWRRFDLRF